MPCRATTLLMICRAWTLAGVAIRNAVSLGLHVRSEADTLTDVEKQMRIRIWWSLYTLERHLDALTGRPSCLSDRDISTPFPANLDEDALDLERPVLGRRDTSTEAQRSTKGSPSKGKPKGRNGLPASRESSTSRRPAKASSSQSPSVTPALSAMSFPVAKLDMSSSTLFIYVVQLSVIAHEILSQLYSPTTILASWGEVQNNMRLMNERLVDWVQSLPEELNFAVPGGSPHAGPRNGLAMLYHSARMKLYRPCLCCMKGRISNESDKSRAFNHASSVHCVDAARDLVACLSDQPDGTAIYDVTPWWTTLNILTEAGSILMLELSFRANHVPHQAAGILFDAKKVVSLLRVMALQAISARKSWEILDGLLRQVAPKVGGNCDDMPRHAAVPYDWEHPHPIPRQTARPHHGGTSGYYQPEGESMDYTHALASSGGPATTTSAWVDNGGYDTTQLFPSAYMPIATTSDFLATMQDFAPGASIYGRYDQHNWHDNFFGSSHELDHMGAMHDPLAGMPLASAPADMAVSAHISGGIQGVGVGGAVGQGMPKGETDLYNHSSVPGSGPRQGFGPGHLGHRDYQWHQAQVPGPQGQSQQAQGGAHGENQMDEGAFTGWGR